MMVDKLTAIQKAIIDLIVNAEDDELDELSEQIDDLICYHRNVKEDVDTYMQEIEGVV